MTAIRVVLTADTHLGFDSAVRARVARRRRGDDFRANFWRILDHARTTRAHLLVIAGDVFHTPRPARALVDETFERLGEVAATGTHVFVLAGNHDRSRLPPSLWLGHPNVYVFDKPRTYTLGIARATVAVGGFPYQRRVGASVADTGVNGADGDLRLLCMHQAVEGARVGLHNYEFRASRDIAPRQALPVRLTAVLAGHVHRAQVIHCDGGPAVYYPGSIERTSFAERDECKGFIELEFRKEAGRWAVHRRFHELPARPMADMVLPSVTSKAELVEAIRIAAGRLPRDAVVRLLPAEEGSPSMSLLSASVVRHAFPATMNVHFSRELLSAGDSRQGTLREHAPHAAG